MNPKQSFALFVALRLVSLAVVLGWALLVIVGILNPTVRAFASRIALPTILGSVLCNEVFKRLARRAERRLR